MEFVTWTLLGGTYVRTGWIGTPPKSDMLLWKDPHQPTKSKQVSWQDIQDMDPDVVVVGCCGFGLERNLDDVHHHCDSFTKLRATRSNRLFACNGNVYIIIGEF